MQLSNTIPEKYTSMGQFLYTNCNTLSENVIERQYARQPELEAKYGKKGKKLSLQDCRYHIFYLGEAICINSKPLFLDYMQWVKVLMHNLGIAEKYLITNLQIIKEIVYENIAENQFTKEEADIIHEYLDAGLMAFEEKENDTVSYIDRNTYYGKLAGEYIDLLIEGKKNAASDLIFSALEKGATIEDIYLNIFQPSQYEVGRLWQTNVISVAKEHYITASTQHIMSRLYPEMISQGNKERTVVATCIGNELHELGVRMVADFFEMDGWNSYYLGANTPAESIIQAVNDTNAQVVIVSATLSINVHKLKALVQELRNSKDLENTTIMVGGHPFNIDPELWKKVGADLNAPDAKQSVALANELFE